MNFYQVVNAQARKMAVHEILISSLSRQAEFIEAGFTPESIAGCLCETVWSDFYDNIESEHQLNQPLVIALRALVESIETVDDIITDEVACACAMAAHEIHSELLGNPGVYALSQNDRDIITGFTHRNQMKSLEWVEETMTEDLFRYWALAANIRPSIRGYLH